MIFPAYITATLSAILATTPRSWVMNITATPVFSCKSFISSNIWACIVTSRAVVGSSAIRTLGLQAKDIAITIRCLIPPENWWGYCLNLFSASDIPTNSISSIALFLASSLLNPWCFIIGSIICLPIVIVGFREVIGSWNIIAISLPLTFSMSFSLILVKSLPSNKIWPSFI